MIVSKNRLGSWIVSFLIEEDMSSNLLTTTSRYQFPLKTNFKYSSNLQLQPYLILSSIYTLQGTNISHTKAPLKIIFRTSQSGICYRSLEGIPNNHGLIHHLMSESLPKQWTLGGNCLSKDPSNIAVAPHSEGDPQFNKCIMWSSIYNLSGYIVICG